MNNDNYINGISIASEVIALKNSTYSMRAQADVVSADLWRLNDKIVVLENKMKTIENLLGITFNENGTIKVRREKK